VAQEENHDLFTVFGSQRQSCFMYSIAVMKQIEEQYMLNKMTP
jgi:hypothetical protein